MERYPLRDFSKAGSVETEDAMERAEVVFYDRCPIELPNAADLEFMRTGLPRELQVKNISYHPESDSIPRFEAAPEISQRIEQILRSSRPARRNISAPHLPRLRAELDARHDQLPVDRGTGPQAQAALEQRARAHRRRCVRRDERRPHPALLREHPPRARPRLGNEGQLSTRSWAATRRSGRPRAPVNHA